jgi:hypothetical protein
LQELIVNIHNVWRYVVLVLALAAIVLSLMAFLGSRPWDNVTDRVTLFYTISLDIQLLIGILVWIFGDWERNDSFLLWVHPVAMVIAVGLGHAGRVMSERASGARSKGARGLAFFGGSLLVILLAIPIAAWPL